MRTDQMVWVLKLAEGHLEELTNQLAVIDDELAEYGAGGPWVEGHAVESAHLDSLYAQRDAVLAELRRLEVELGVSAEKLLEDVRGLREAFEESLELSRTVDDRGYRQSLGYTVAFQHPPWSSVADFDNLGMARKLDAERRDFLKLKAGSAESDQLVRKFLASPDNAGELQSCPQAAGVYTEVDASDLFGFLGLPKRAARCCRCAAPTAEPGGLCELCQTLEEA